MRQESEAIRQQLEADHQRIIGLEAAQRDAVAHDPVYDESIKRRVT